MPEEPVADLELWPSEEHRQVCDFCRHRAPFTVPDSLLDDILGGRLTIFAGAGISTERDDVLPDTLLGVVRRAMNLPPDAPFSAAMSAYEEAKGRGELLRLIRRRLDYIESFPEMLKAATRFHLEFSTLGFVTDIITTNWDTYFEDICLAVPIVTPADYAYWDTGRRRVFKLHGSINNPGTIIASAADYRHVSRQLRRGVMGGTLRHVLATQSLLVVGYSFGDEHFNQIYRYIRRELGQILPRSYLVTIDQRVTPQTHPGPTIIHTDASFFLSHLKRRLVERGELMPDSKLAESRDLHFDASVQHVALTREVDVPAASSNLFARLSGWTVALARTVFREGPVRRVRTHPRRGSPAASI